MQLLVDIPLSKKIGTLAGPVIVAMLFQTVINQLDTAMVGRLPGATGIDGQAGIGLSLPLFWAMGGFLSAIGIGTQAIAARRTGENRPRLAGIALSNSLTIAIISSAAVSVLGYYLSPAFFRMMSPNPNVVHLGSSYCAIRMIGVFTMVTTMSYKSFFDGIGKTHVHMVASILMNLLNAGLNLLLIFGLWGFPRLEVDGAAIASVISTYVGLAVMIIWSLLPSYLKKYRYYKLKNLDKHVSWEIIRLSVPSGMATVFVMSGFLFFLWVIANLPKGPQWLDALSFLPLAGPLVSGIDAARPDLATSASWSMISFLMLVFITSMAFGTATATLVSQSLGAKKPDLAERYGWESAKIGILVMGLVGLAMIIHPSMFMRIFTPKQEVIDVALPAMRLVGSVTALMSAGMILVQALFGAGNTRFVMIAEMLMHSLCLIPLSYVLGMVLGLGLLGCWMAAAAYAVALSSIMAWKFYQGKWKQIKI